MPCVNDLYIQVDQFFYPLAKLNSFNLAGPGIETSYNFSVEVPQGTPFPKAEEHFLLLKKPTNIALPIFKLLGGVVKEGDVVPASVFGARPHQFNVRCVSYAEFLEETEINTFATTSITPLDAVIFGVLIKAGLNDTAAVVELLDVEVFSDDPIELEFIAQPGQTAKSILDAIAEKTACRWYVNHGDFTDINAIFDEEVTEVAKVIFVHQDYTSPDGPIAHIKVTSECLLPADTNRFWSDLKYKFGKVKPTEWRVASNPEVAENLGAPVSPAIFERTVLADAPDSEFGPIDENTIALEEIKITNYDNWTEFVTVTAEIYNGETITGDAALDLINKKVLFPTGAPPSSYFPGHPVIVRIEQTHANFYGSAVDEPLENYLGLKRRGTGTCKTVAHQYDPGLRSSAEAILKAQFLREYSRQNRIASFEFTSDRDLSPAGVPWRPILQKVILEITDLEIFVTLPILSVQVNPIANSSAIATKNTKFNYFITCGQLPRLTPTGTIMTALNLAKTSMMAATTPMTSNIAPPPLGPPCDDIEATDIVTTGDVIGGTGINGGNATIESNDLVGTPMDGLYDYTLNFMNPEIQTSPGQWTIGWILQNAMIEDMPADSTATSRLKIYLNSGLVLDEELISIRAAMTCGAGTCVENLEGSLIYNMADYFNTIPEIEYEMHAEILDTRVSDPTPETIDILASVAVNLLLNCDGGGGGGEG